MSSNQFFSPFGVRNVNVKWFDAKGNGVKDDTEAIQKAINYVGDLGGGFVYFPPGTYIVHPQNDQRIELRSNITLAGAGESSCLKIKDDAGDYFTVFGQLNNGPKDTLRGVTIRNLRIDQNPKGNTTCNISKSNPNPYHRQHVFSFYNFENITIEHVSFHPTTSMNTITLNKRTARFANVKNCFFNFERGKSTDKKYDNSAIYFQCFEHMAIGNQFTTKVGEGAGAIETHTGISIISNNMIKNYHVGVHVQHADHPHPNMNIQGNNLIDVGRGVLLWGNEDIPLENVNVSNNLIKVNNLERNVLPIGGIICASNSHKSNIINMNIIGNNIMFQEEKEDEDREINLTYVAGIGLDHKFLKKQNINITNNTINKSPSLGISLGNFNNTGTSENVMIQGNSITNAGHAPYGNKKRKNFIEVRGQLLNVLVANNIILETYEKGRANAAISSIAASPTSENVRITENLIHSSQNLPILDCPHSKVHPTGLELKSPSGKKYRLSVDDEGTIITSLI